MAISLNQLDTYQRFRATQYRDDNISSVHKPIADSPKYSNVFCDEVIISGKNKKIDRAVKFNSKDLEVCKVLSPARKVLDCYEDYVEGNYIYASGMAFRLVNDFGKDTTRIKNAFIPDANYDPHWQKPFRFLHESLLDKTKLGEYLTKYDKSLFDYKITRRLLKSLGMKKCRFGKDGNIKIECSLASKILGGTALRIPLLGVGLYMLIGTDGIFKAKNNKDRARELAKDVINAVTIWTVAGLLGCIGRHYGKLTDLLFMGAGFVLGRVLAKKINERLLGNVQPNNQKYNRVLPRYLDHLA